MTELNSSSAETTARSLFDRYYDPLCLFFAKKGQPVDEARDLAQETFTKALLTVARMPDPANAGVWLFLIAKNIYLNILRKDRKDVHSRRRAPLKVSPESVETDEDEPTDLLDRLLAREKRERLRRAIGELPPRMREAILLSVYHDLPFDQIAAILGVSTGTVGSLLVRARDRLREQLGGEFEAVESPPSEALHQEAWNRLRPRLPRALGSDRTLASLLSEDSPVSPSRAIELAAATARTLARLHSRGQVLSDLRPENIVLEPSGEVRIVETGLAPIADTFEVGYGRLPEEAVASLYRFLSPEQVARGGFTTRSNLFSLGALLYELLTGTSPFRDSTPLATASRILSFDPEPVIDLVPEVPSSLSELIDHLLAKDPEERPRDAAAVARALEQMIEAPPAQTRSRTPTASDLEAEIERLYDRIILLGEDSTMEPAARDQEIERAYARLLELQTAEAESFRERFEASLEMPIDAGEQILARARRLREELEDLAAGDAATEHSGSP